MLKGALHQPALLTVSSKSAAVTAPGARRSLGGLQRMMGLWRLQGEMLRAGVQHGIKG